MEDPRGFAGEVVLAGGTELHREGKVDEGVHQRTQESQRGSGKQWVLM